MVSFWRRGPRLPCPLPGERNRQTFSTIGPLICCRFRVKAEAPRQLALCMEVERHCNATDFFPTTGGSKADAPAENLSKPDTHRRHYATRQVRPRIRGSRIVRL